ncbi:hypothetical protein M408DRAFT_195993 [Serendipita vermifera MAFF 305830]|uniref:RlpA-like protein double-psi beta-barrel domain-containing protein n=1 Tax=Serendipita vermifera MAFF 305830 TaxID=933852 RepID=A0A0C3AP58_SERVB|nr:hypothetical protein M408DRAFT_195993 [Serendipita vermifera MAFF 305830]
MFGLLVAALAAPLLAFAAPTDLAKRAPGELSKRTPGRATYYAVGLGACGQYNVPGDFIVALNQAQFETGTYPSTQCFRGITITYNGKTAHATVMDECPSGGCGYGDLDFSEGLFTYFEPTSTGVFYMSWEFDGAGGGGYTPPVANTPVYTPPADTYTPPTTTSTPPPTSTSTSTSSSSSSSSSSEGLSVQEVAPSDTPEAAPSGDAQPGDNINNANAAAYFLGRLVYAAGGSA